MNSTDFCPAGESPTAWNNCLDPRLAGSVPNQKSSGIDLLHKRRTSGPVPPDPGVRRGDVTRLWRADVMMLASPTKTKMQLLKVAALVLAVGAPGLMSVSLARGDADCSMSVTLADWGRNSTGYIDLKSGETCRFPITMDGTLSVSEISKKPAHGKLKKLNPSSYEYQAKARYKGSDTFAIKATGQSPTASGTSVITVHATIK